ncbi:MAG: HIT domain-containing protein [Thaumarchaeota archaeon]|nr:HIT domain-containing protein [Nitrososphaerota archaeon]
MKILWAPWRMTYIKKVCEKNSECFLCKAAKENRDEENLVVFRGSKCFVVVNKYPYNNGHLLIAPYRHISSLLDLSEEESLEIMRILRLSIKALREEYRPEGFNVGLNLGRASGAGLEDHLHLHVVPRWTGDTNFMPIFSETKVVPELPGETWKKLKKHFDRLRL